MEKTKIEKNNSDKIEVPTELRSLSLNAPRVKKMITFAALKAAVIGVPTTPIDRHESDNLKTERSEHRRRRYYQGVTFESHPNSQPEAESVIEQTPLSDKVASPHLPLEKMLGLDQVSVHSDFHALFDLDHLEDRISARHFGRAKEYEVWDFMPPEIVANTARESLSVDIFALGTQMRAFLESLGAPHIDNPQQRQRGIVLFNSQTHKAPDQYLKEMGATIVMMANSFVSRDEFDGSNPHVWNDTWKGVMDYCMLDYKNEFIRTAAGGSPSHRFDQGMKEYEALVEKVQKALLEVKAEEKPTSVRRVIEAGTSENRRGWVHREDPESGKKTFVKVGKTHEDEYPDEQKWYNEHIRERQRLKDIEIEQAAVKAGDKRARDVTLGENYKPRGR